MQSPVYEPAELKIACEAFDMAWSEIGPQFSHSAQAQQVAQLRLANAVLALAGDHIRTPQELRDHALGLLVAKLDTPRPNH